MKNFFKIIFILSLTIFAVTGCADNSGGNNGGGNTGVGGNTGEVYTPEFTRLISIGGLSYGETADGKKYAWGNVGELTGAGNTDNIRTPKEVDFTIIDNITDYSYSTYYIITDTGLYAWGANFYGQVGNGTTDDVLTPHKVQGIEGNIKQVIAYGSNVYIITDTGLYAWGSNRNGQVGNGTTDDVLTPHKVEGIDGNIKEFIIDDSTVYVLTDTGLYAWGNNSYGQVGNGTSGNNVLTPHKAVDGNIKEFKIIGYTYYAITEDGLYIWGDNWNGQVGNGTSGNDVLTPHKVAGIEGNIKEIIRKTNTVYVLTDTGLYAWGYNYYGQVGNGTSGNNVLTPHKVQGIEGNIKEIVYNNRTVYVLTDTGLYAWGDNWDGQVGNGTSGGKVLTPHKVEGIDGNIKDVIANNDTVYILTDTGLYAWGDNLYGQVGNGTSGGKVLTPHTVEGIEGNIKEIVYNNGTVYVLTDDGLYAWGANFYGQVGNGKTDNVRTPHKVEGIEGNIKEIVYNNGTVYVLTVYVLTDTGLYAWSRNDSGQVGNGTSGANVLTPHKVVDGNIKDIIAGSTVYIITDTGLYAWGNNDSGQVGNGTSGGNVLTPYKAVDGNIKEVIASNNNVHVLTDTGLYAWGDNSYGQVGNGTTDNVLTPYKVQKFR